jgi:hypothetical protein
VLFPDNVRELASRQHEGGHNQGVQRYSGLDALDSGIEALHQSSDGHIHNGRVDDDDEHRQRHDD